MQALGTALRKLSQMPVKHLSRVFTVTGPLAKVFNENHTSVVLRTLRAAQPLQTPCHPHTAIMPLHSSTQFRLLGVLRKYLNRDYFLVTKREPLEVSKLLFKNLLLLPSLQTTVFLPPSATSTGSCSECCWSKTYAW